MTESADADRDPPECICENATKKLHNPDCYWHGTEGVEILETKRITERKSMKFTQFNSHMITGPNGPIIGLFALGEDGNLYQYERLNKDVQYWTKLSSDVKFEGSSPQNG